MRDSSCDAGDRSAVAARLRGWLDRRRAEVPGYSFRDFAREAGESNGTILHAVLSGARRATPDMILRWRAALALSEDEHRWLFAAALVEEAEHELERRARWRQRRQTPDALRQEALAAARLGELRAALFGLEARGAPPGATAPVELAWPVGGSGAAAPLLPWLQEGLVRCQQRRPAGAPGHALLALTEETGPQTRARLVETLDQLQHRLLARVGAGPRAHVQLTLFPLTRSTLDGSDALPAQQSPPLSPAEPIGDDPPDIFHFGHGEEDGLRPYLSAWWLWKKRQDPDYSFRDFADATEQPDRTWLYKVLDQRQRVTPLRARQLASALELDDQEDRYLLTLAERDLARGPRRARLDQRLRELRALGGTKRPNAARVARYRDALPWALSTLMSCVGARPDPVWLAEHLWPPVRPDQVSEYLPYLLPGAGEGRHWELLDDQSALVGGVKRDYHRAMKEAAIAAFSTKDPAPINPVAMAVTAPMAGMSERELQALLSAAAVELQRICAGSGEAPDMVVQINLHGWMPDEPGPL